MSQPWKTLYDSLNPNQKKFVDAKINSILRTRADLSDAAGVFSVLHEFPKLELLLTFMRRGRQNAKRSTLPLIKKSRQQQKSQSKKIPLQEEGKIQEFMTIQQLMNLRATSPQNYVRAVRALARVKTFHERRIGNQLQQKRNLWKKIRLLSLGFLPGLTVIRVDNIGTDHEMMLTGAIASGKCPDLESIDFEGTTDYGGVALATALSSGAVRNLISIHVRHFSVPDMIALATAIRSGHLSGLTSLYISGIDSIDIVTFGTLQIVKTLEDGFLRNLTFLGLQGGHMDDEGIQHLINAVEKKHLRKLIFLSLSDHLFSAPKARELCRCLSAENVPELKELDFMATEVDDDCMMILSQNRNLRYLDVKGTNVTETGIWSFRKALQQKGIHIRSRTISEARQQDFTLEYNSDFESEAPPQDFTVEYNTDFESEDQQL